MCILLIDNLILAYRSKYYDWNIEQLKGFISKNRTLLLIFVAFIILLIGVLYSSVYARSIILTLILLIIELIFCIFADRLTVKRYQQFISAKHNHLNNVVQFLQTTVPDNNLYNPNQIDMIIERLTIRIDASLPFKAFNSNLISFGKAIIFPAITFVAGVYSNAIGQMDIQVVLTWTVTGIILLGIFNIMWSFLSKTLQKVTCRDYDAAIAFREDLLDIKLLLLTSHSSHSQPTE